MSALRLSETQLPWYAVNSDNRLDQFFTDRGIAERCYAGYVAVAKKHGVDLSERVFVEPSAGEGCFTDLLPRNSICLDIDPKHRRIKKANFLTWDPPAGRKFAVIGNPPFGVRGAIALAFINRAALFSDYVGFILPMTFGSDGKGGAMTRVKGLDLLHSEELPPDSFYDGNTGETKSLNTLWQVWGRGVKTASPKRTCASFVDLYTVCTAKNRRCGLTRMDQYDYFIQGTFYANRPPRVVTDFDDVKYGSGYGIIIKRQKRKIASLLRGTDWLKHSSKATNHCRHIRMSHIREVITGAGFYDTVLA